MWYNYSNFKSGNFLETDESLELNHFAQELATTQPSHIYHNGIF